MNKLILLFGLVAVMSACGGNVKTSNTVDQDSITIKEVVDTTVVDSLVVDSIPNI